MPKILGNQVLKTIKEIPKTGEFHVLQETAKDYLCRNNWKSSATIIKEIPKSEFHVLQETAKDYLCQKLKTWIGFVWLRN